MCGRYYINDETAKEIDNLLKELDQKSEVKTGEIYPTNTVPIYTSYREQFIPKLVIWGYPGFKNNNVIINARVETITEKRMFKDSLSSKRCIVPASAFYEWDKEKNKICFGKSDFKMLYLAGIYNSFSEQENRFVIITTNANKSMKEVHHRMPLIFEEEQAKKWLTEHESIENLLNIMPEELIKI